MVSILFRTQCVEWLNYSHKSVPKLLAGLHYLAWLPADLQWAKQLSNSLPIPSYLPHTRLSTNPDWPSESANSYFSEMIKNSVFVSMLPFPVWLRSRRLLDIWNTLTIKPQTLFNLIYYITTKIANFNLNDISVLSVLLTICYPSIKGLS